MGGGPPEAGTGAYHAHDPPVQLLLRGLAPELGLLERPVLDVEGLLLVHGFVTVDRLRPPHHLDGAVVELGGHPGLALVLPPGDHPQPRNEDHRSTWIAHPRRAP